MATRRERLARVVAEADQVAQLMEHQRRGGDHRSEADCRHAWPHSGAGVWQRAPAFPSPTGNVAITERSRLRRPPGRNSTEMNYADVHFHLLPGVDDGPEDMTESVELARAAVADGTIDRGGHSPRPHRLRDRASRAPRAGARAARGAGGARIPLRCAAAVSSATTSWDPGQDSWRRSRRALREPLDAGGGPVRGNPARLPCATAELRQRGFAVVIAHPERVAYASTEGMRALRNELAAGSVGAGQRDVAHRRSWRRGTRRRARLRGAGTRAGRGLGRPRRGAPAVARTAWAALIDAGLPPRRHGASCGKSPRACCERPVDTLPARRLSGAALNEGGVVARAGGLRVHTVRRAARDRSPAVRLRGSSCALSGGSSARSPSSPPARSGWKR